MKISVRQPNGDESWWRTLHPAFHPYARDGGDVQGILVHEMSHLPSGTVAEVEGKRYLYERVGNTAQVSDIEV